MYKRQQWDFPNAWPPLQDIAIEGLRKMAYNIGDIDDKTRNEILSSSTNIAKTFLEGSYITWKRTGDMFEKYDVRERGKSGHGGEYDVQVGFGWTNGVILKILKRYGEFFIAPTDFNGCERLVGFKFLLIGHLLYAIVTIGRYFVD